MPGIFDIFNGGGNQSTKEDEKFIKNAAKIQDFVNKYRIRSRDLTGSAPEEIQSQAYAPGFQSYAWIDDATATSNNRATRYKEYRDMMAVPELNQSVNIYADNCLHPDTEIWTLNGKFTIKQLSEMYKSGEEFEIWSYNIEKHRIDIGKAHSPRKTGSNKDVYKITFDNNSYIIATSNHPILMNNYEYKNVENIKPGERVIPFNSFIKNGHHIISTLKYGQKSAHQYAWFIKNNEFINKPFCIHHKDENKLNNNISNLEKLTIPEHIKIHSDNRWKSENHKEFMLKLFNERILAGREKIRSDKIKNSWTYNRKVEFGNYIKSLYMSNPSYKENIKHVGSKNGRYLNDLTSDFIYVESKKYREYTKFIKDIGFSNEAVRNRMNKLGFKSWEDLRKHHAINLMVENKNKSLSHIIKISPYSRSYFYDIMKEKGFSCWSDFQNNYENHQVVSIEYYGKSDVYDLTVDNFHNFNANGIIVHNCTQYNIQGNVMEIESGNNKIIEILEKLFFDNLDMNSNLWKIVRNTCKLGDEFLEVVLDNPNSPKHIISLERIKNPENIKRIEKDGSLIGFRYEFDEEDKKPQMFQPWQIVHFKIEDEEFDPYGKSILEAGRKTFKKLSLMEDAMLVYRISRAPERRVFYVDVGTMPTKEANKFIETLKRQFRKKKYINQNTGEVDEKANPLSVDEDFYIPVRQNSQGTRIETLPGGQNLGEIDDVKYFKDQILKTMGIPSGYLGGTAAEGAAGTYDPKSYLSNQEIQFSRTIERIQKLIIRGLEKVAFIELILSRLEKTEIKDFKIKLTPPSNVDQLMEIEIRNQQFALIQQIRTLENFLPDEWIYTEVLGLNEQQIQKIRLQLQMQQQMALQLQSLAGGGGQGTNMGSGAPMGMAGGNIAGGPTPGGEAGGPPEGEAPIEAPAEPGLEVASNMIEFDGAKWLMENQKDVEKLLKYVKLYEKVHKDNKDKVNERRNSATRMLIEGEFRGLVKAYQSSNEIILREENILLGKMKKKKTSRSNTSNT